MSNENKNNNQSSGQQKGPSQSAQSVNDVKALKEGLKQLVREGEDFNDIIKDQVRELNKLINGYDKVRSSIDGFRTSSLDVKRIQGDINRVTAQSFIQRAKITETQVKLSANQLKDADNYLAALQKRQDAEKELNDARAEGNLKAISEANKKLNSADREIENRQALLTPLEAEYVARKKSLEVSELTGKELDIQLKKEKQIRNSIGLTGIAAENFAKKLGVGEEVYEAMILKARKLQAQQEAAAVKRASEGKEPLKGLQKGLQSVGNKFKVFGTGMGSLFKSAVSSLADPAVLAVVLGKIGSGISNVFKSAAGILGSAMKGIGGELAEGPIQNLTKPISGFLEKIPLVGGLLGGVVDMMSTFMDLAVNANSQFVKMGRELGLDAAESQKLANNFSDIAQNSSDVFLNAKRLYEAQIDLGRQLGTTAIFSKEILSTNIKLKDILGLEEDIQASIAQTSVITGKESADIVGNVIQQVQNLQKAGLAAQDYKAVLKEVSNLGGYLGLTFAKYPEKITKAVLQVKAMGLELKQVDALADSFLDYETSISKEMEAQVLTGREMNLNKAREAALNNDLVGLAEEITKNAGSVDAFLKDNRINQQAIAEAVGLSRDTLSDMLKKQMFLSKIGATDKTNAEDQYKLAKAKFATLKDITNEQEKQQYIEIVSGTAQERLAGLINKIKQGFIELTSNSGVTEFIDKAIKFMSDPSQIQGFVNGLKDFFATVLEGVGTFVNAAAKIANIFLIGKDEIAEDYGDTIKGFAQNLRGSSLGKLRKLDEGGLVQTSGVAEVHSGETYLGANSLQLIKMTAENSRKTVELLAKLANQKSDGSNSQIKFVTGNVVLDGVPTGKLMLNSFENNSYTKFDTTRYNS
jgi:transcriptional regulator with XRE-family HTH domain